LRFPFFSLGVPEEVSSRRMLINPPLLYFPLTAHSSHRLFEGFPNVLGGERRHPFSSIVFLLPVFWAFLPLPSVSARIPVYSFLTHSGIYSSGPFCQFWSLIFSWISPRVCFVEDFRATSVLIRHLIRLGRRISFFEGIGFTSLTLCSHWLAVCCVFFDFSVFFFLPFPSRFPSTFLGSIAGVRF